MRIFTLVTLGILMICTTVFAQTEKKHPKIRPACDVTSFEWMIGTWIMTTPDGRIIESWDKDSNWVYHGSSVTLKGKDTVFVERMRIRQTEDSGMVFGASVPHNDGEVSFELIAGGSASMKFIFENLSHDFPQRVIYHYRHLKDGDSLYARIEGVVKGKPDSAAFAYRRK